MINCLIVRFLCILDGNVGKVWLVSCFSEFLYLDIVLLDLCFLLWNLYLCVVYVYVEKVVERECVLI